MAPNCPLVNELINGSEMSDGSCPAAFPPSCWRVAPAGCSGHAAHGHGATALVTEPLEVMGTQKYQISWESFEISQRVQLSPV